MTGHRSRLYFVALLFALSLSLSGCSGSQQPTGNTGNTSPTGGTGPTTSPGGPPSYEGYFDIANCDAIIAWGWDANRPNDPIKLDIYDGTVMVATVTADNFRQDLLDVGKGNGKHAIFWPIPPQMKDGKKHVLSVKYAGTDMELGTSPKDINCTLTPQ